MDFPASPYILCLILFPDTRGLPYNYKKEFLKKRGKKEQKKPRFSCLKGVFYGIMIQ